MPKEILKLFSNAFANNSSVQTVIPKEIAKLKGITDKTRLAWFLDDQGFIRMEIAEVEK